MFSLIKNFEQAIKSLKVFFLFNILPSSYHCLPRYSPPLICAIAKTNPLSSKDNRIEENDGSTVIPYEPYAYSNIGVSLLSLVDMCLTNEIGIFFPSSELAQILSEI